MPLPLRHAAALRAHRGAAQPGRLPGGFLGLPGHGARLAAAAATLAACGGPQKVSWDTAAAVSLAIEVLPRLALVEMDGQVLGRGARSQPLARGGRHRLRASADGFEPLEVEVEAGGAAGRTVFLVLRPEGFGSGRRLEAGEPVGLARAAARLLAAGRVGEAMDYARQSLAAGENAPAHKVLGAAHARAGERALAIRHYSAYLALDPEAPDAAQVQRLVEAARGDIALPPRREDRAIPSR